MRIGSAAVMLAVVLGGAGTGCATQADPAAQGAATEFARAVAGRDGAAACRLLAPATRSELEQSAGKRCATAILEAGLPRAGATEEFSTFGTMAQVRFRGDVMFISEFKSGWKVMAAGCSPVPKRPYECQLQGG